MATFLQISCVVYYSLVTTQSSLKWSISPATLPRYDYGMAVGYSDTTNLIWVIGGKNNQQQLVAFDPFNSSSSFLVDTANGLSHDLYSYGQGYTQIDNIVYMIDPSGTKLSTFDMSSHQFIYNYNDIVMPITAKDNADCLTHIGKYLIITGGIDDDYNALSNVPLYDLNNSSWILSANNLSSPRTHHACIVNENTDYLYVIGGWNGNNTLNTISKLYVGDIDHINLYNWIDLVDTLRTPKVGLRAVMLNEDIFVIGGRHWSSSLNEYVASPEVDRISADDEVMVDTDLSKAVSFPSCIVVNNTLFVLGGMEQSRSTNTIQYTIISSLEADAVNEASLMSPTFAAIICIAVLFVFGFVILDVIYLRKKKRIQILLDAQKEHVQHKEKATANPEVDGKPKEDKETSLEIVLEEKFETSEERKTESFERIWTELNEECYNEMQTLLIDLKEALNKVDQYQEENKSLKDQVSDLLDEKKEMELMIMNLRNQVEQMKRGNIDKSDYMEWNHEQILLWILSLENGYFRKYSDNLSQEMSESKIKGRDLRVLNTKDIRGFGIKTFSDAKILEQYIQELVNKGHNYKYKRPKVDPIKCINI